MQTRGVNEIGLLREVTLSQVKGLYLTETQIFILRTRFKVEERRTKMSAPSEEAAESQMPLPEDCWELLSQGAEGKVMKPFQFVVPPSDFVMRRCGVWCLLDNRRLRKR